MKQFLFALTLILLIGCSKKTEMTSPEVVQVDYEKLTPYLQAEEGKIRIINFWATWCKPCVEEIPEFQKLYGNYKDENVELIMVSLDFENQYEAKLLPYIAEHQLQGIQLHMIDPDQNDWIPKVSESWSGAIPATIVISENKSEFFEQPFTYKELETVLKTHLK